MRSGLRGCLGGTTAAMAQLGGNTGRNRRGGPMAAHRPLKSGSCGHGSLFVSQSNAVLCSCTTGCRPDRSPHLTLSLHTPLPSLSLSISASLIASVSGRHARHTRGSRNGEMGSFRRETQEAKAKAKAYLDLTRAGVTGRYLKIMSSSRTAECSSYGGTLHSLAS